MSKWLKVQFLSVQLQSIHSQAFFSWIVIFIMKGYYDYVLHSLSGWPRQRQRTVASNVDKTHLMTLEASWPSSIQESFYGERDCFLPFGSTLTIGWALVIKSSRAHPTCFLFSFILGGGGRLPLLNIDTFSKYLLYDKYSLWQWMLWFK